MFRFLHAADIHLDSPLRGLARYEGAPAEMMRKATRRAFENLVRLALAERVAFVLIAGDLYDGDWKDYNTGLHFIEQMKKLGEARIRVFLITGNHDAANRMTRALRLPDNVTLLSTERPETHVLDDYAVAIHGQGFASASIRENLSLQYPAALRHCFNIGLLHTCATGRDGHEPYAPCTVEGLLAKEYDYWALGHIHKRETLHDEVPIVFPGNVQGRNIRETGPKGCMLVSVQGPGRVEAEFRPLDVLRWEVCAADATGAADGEDVLERVADRLHDLRQASEGRPLAVRVEVTGICAAHDELLADPVRWINEVRASAIELGDGDLWVEKVKLRTQPPRDLGSLPADGPLGELLAVIDQLREDDARLRDLCQSLRELDELSRKLPGELRQGPEPFQLEDPAWLRSVLDQVQPLLVNQLLAGGRAR